MVTYFTTAAEAVAEGLSTADGRDLAVDELTIDHLEWDVLWRVTFGGVARDAPHRPAQVQSAHRAGSPARP